MKSSTCGIHNRDLFSIWKPLWKLANVSQIRRNGVGGCLLYLRKVILISADQVQHANKRTLSLNDKRLSLKKAQPQSNLPKLLQRQKENKWKDPDIASKWICADGIRGRTNRKTAKSLCLKTGQDSKSILEKRMQEPCRDRTENTFWKNIE